MTDEGPASPSSQPAAPPPGAPEAEPFHRGGSGTALLGGLLIAVGLVFFVGQWLDVDWGAATWPFYVIAPGLALLAFGLTQRDGSGLTVAGSIVTIVGLLLLYQNATDHWESWAYAWALVGPGGSGLGMLLYGTRSGNRKMARQGFWQVLTAIGLFVAGFIFFEGIIGISGRRLPLPDWVLPAAVIGLGVLVLIRGFTSRDRGDDQPVAPSGDEGS
jgi:O-antigen/teichoic acid export membrane protein